MAAKSLFDEDEEKQTEPEEEELLLSHMHGFQKNVAVIYAASGGIVVLCVMILLMSELTQIAARGLVITAIVGITTFYLTYNVSFYLSSFGQKADKEMFVQAMSVLTSLLTTLTGTLFAVMLIYLYFLPLGG
ncbi:MAG: hypothetical protein RLO08_10910 [Parvibaculaceae bacterium]